MDDLHRRWFEPPTVEAAVSSMLHQFSNVPPAQSDAVQSERDRLKTKYTMVAAGAAVVFLLALIGGLLLFAPKPAGRDANYLGLALLSVGLIAGVAAATYLTSGSNNKKRARRDEAFEDLCRQHPGLRPARRTEVDASSAETIPWFHSEEWSHTYGLASGEYQGSPIMAVECTHVVDPILVTTDSRLMQGLAGIGSSKHKRLFLRAMDATIFVQPLPDVPDLLFVPRMDPSRAYYKRALAQQSCDLADAFQLPRELRRKYFMASAAPEQCADLFATELPALLVSRKWCIVQVVGGYCVVLTSQWHNNYPGRAPSTLAAISANLEFAQAVYRQLRRSSKDEPGGFVADAEYGRQPAGNVMATAVAEGTEPSGVTASVAQRQTRDPRFAEPPAKAAAVAQAAVVTPSRNRRRPHSLLAKLCLLGMGIPLFLFGLLGTIGISIDRHRGLTAAAWPQVEARITDSRFDVQTRRRQGQEVLEYQPRVSYEYVVNGQEFTGNRLQFGVASATMSKPEADRVLARYPKGAVAKVHYLATSPRTSVLEPGLLEEAKLVVYIWVTGAFTLFGFLLSGYAIAGKRARTA